MNYSYAILFLMSLWSYSIALECYVCDNQEENEEKCGKTIEICNYGEDVCLTEIRWGSTPYWQQGALKQYYISKRCSTKDKCEKFRSSNMAACTHIWYEDWKCSECCKGDRCNYYIISKAPALNYSPLLMVGLYIFIQTL
ncbi:uncharacterized protein LOC126742581 isoform X2 [Anthonomus grandis grandis]|uniref:uncharacterized protein LOC126742581 isoform X2 n=1 Tax=Anthonomus grandis grandis TaxID=2921223 RepID=UPI002165D4FC|nr:uncharacterized protein LOC126742581 isoform X2 [Anthonomus grandis grandis]